MKIVAKTKGPTLVCSSGDFLDSYKYRVVAYDPQVRGWNNRNLLDVKGFVEDSSKVDDLEELGIDAFLKKWSNIKQAAEVEVKQEAEVEVKQEAEPEAEPEVEVKKKNRKNKK